MQLLFLVFGLVAVFVGGLLEFYGGLEVHGGGNWFMMIFGAICVVGGLGTIPHDKPQPSPAPKKTARTTSRNSHRNRRAGGTRLADESKIKGSRSMRCTVSGLC